MMGKSPKETGLSCPAPPGEGETGKVGFALGALRSPWVSRLGAPAVSAGALFLAFPTAHLHPLAWLALVPLILSCAHAGPKGAFLRFFFAGWLFHSLTLQWLWANIFWAGGWAIIGQQFLCVALALFWGVCGGVWAAGRRRWAFGGALELAVLWWFIELGMANLFTGFGWTALGYTQGAVLPVAQWAALGGVSLVSFLLMGVNAHLALAICGKHRLLAGCAAVLLVGIAFSGGLLLLESPSPEDAPLRAGIVQPMFSQEVKWDPHYARFLFDTLEDMTRAMGREGRMDLVVWPEAAVPDALPAAEVDARLKALAHDLDCVLLTGYGRDDRAAGRSYNSLMAVAPDGAEPASYDKVRLAAFGEYVPFGEYLPFLEAIAFGGVSAGEKQRLLPASGLQVGPLICFEVLFSGMSRNLRKMGADCLLVVTNLAWFGASNAVMQELEIARFRAVETRLPLIHCSNTGISGVFDPFGRFHPVNMQYFSGGQVRAYDAERFPVGAGMSRRLVGILDIPGKGAGCMAPWWAGALVFLSVLALSLLWRRVCPPRSGGESA